MRGLFVRLRIIESSLVNSKSEGIKISLVIGLYGVVNQSASAILLIQMTRSILISTTRAPLNVIARETRTAGDLKLQMKIVILSASRFNLLFQNFLKIWIFLKHHKYLNKPCDIKKYSFWKKYHFRKWPTQQSSTQKTTN